MEISPILISLAIGIGVFVIINVFMGVLGGQTYNLVEDDILEIGQDGFIEELSVLNNTETLLSYDDGDISSYVIKSGSTTLDNSNFTLTASSITPTAELVENYTSLNITYNYGNAEIGGYITDGISGSFQGSKTLGEYTPLIVLSVVIFLVLILVTRFTGATNTNKGEEVL